eukprot:1520380-Prymnesium_polylepis.1
MGAAGRGARRLRDGANERRRDPDALSRREGATRPAVRRRRGRVAIGGVRRLARWGTVGCCVWHRPFG